MKKYALGAAALILSCISWSVAAADKPTLEERCRAIAKQHGMPAEEVDAWVEKCLDHTKAMMARHPQGEQKQPHEDKSGQPGEEQQHNGRSTQEKNDCAVVAAYSFGGAAGRRGRARGGGGERGE